MLGYIAATARTGVDVVSFGAPTGPSGVVASRTDFAKPYFDTLAGLAVYPAYHVVAGLAPAAGCRVREIGLLREGSLAALAWETNSGCEIWIANLTGNVQSLSLTGADFRQGRGAVLDEDNFTEAATEPNLLRTAARVLRPTDPLTLKAYSVARIELPAG
jgi:hypothetical protein